MGDSIWNNFLDETMKERYELVAERIVEISKEPQVPIIRRVMQIQPMQLLFLEKKKENCLVFCGQSWMWRLLMPLRENWQN